MPPRQDDDKMVHRSAATLPSPASRPTLFDLPKDISFLEIQQPLPLVNDNHALAAASSLVRQRMASSLEKATERADELHQRMAQEDTQNRYPFVHDACRSALVDELSRVLNQATMLLEDAKQEDPDVPQMTKNKRVSVALVHALQYLDTLESAMAFSSRDRLETGIRSVLRAITDKSSKEEDPLPKVCVSSWTAPSLAFDFQTGSTASLAMPACIHEPLSLPMDLEVRPIIEYTAEELVQSYGLHADAFAVTVEKCTHELREYGTRDGITGEAMIQVHIAPLAESNRKRQAVWGRNDDVEPIRLKEVRA
jgi:hypothetical protein